MKFVCSRQAFEAAMNLLLGAVSAQTPKQVLRCILLEREEASICLSATDFEIWIQHNIETEGIEGDGSILLPADKLAGIARGEWNESLTFNIENNLAEITTATNRYRLAGYPNIEEFPRMAEIAASSEATMLGADLADALQKTYFAAAHSDTRFAMNGVLFNIGSDHIEFVASDTHRLSVVRKKMLSKPSLAREAIVINKGAAVIAKAAEGEQETKLELTDRELRFSGADKIIISRLVEGKFPKYQEVIPSCPYSLVVGRESIIRALRLLSGIGREEMKTILFEILPGENKIVLSASDVSANEGTTTIGAEEIDGPEMKMGFNCAYLLDVFRVMHDEKVIMRYKDAKTAIRIDSESFLHVIMPVRI